LPIRIDEDRITGHDRVIGWTMACLVLHNLLIDLQEDDLWLEWAIEADEALEKLEAQGGNDWEYIRKKKESRAAQKGCI